MSPVRDWKGFPREQTELLAAATEALEILSSLPGDQGATANRLELAIEDFKFKNAVA